jgi:hypothetical protein
VWAAGRAVVTSAWGARPFWPRERSMAWKARGFGRADHGRCLFVSALFRALDAHIASGMRRVHARSPRRPSPPHDPPPTSHSPPASPDPFRCTRSSAATASPLVSGGAAKGRRAAQRRRLPRRRRLPLWRLPRRCQWAHRRLARVRVRVRVPAARRWTLRWG